MESGHAKRLYDVMMETTKLTKREQLLSKIFFDLGIVAAQGEPSISIIEQVSIYADIAKRAEAFKDDL